MDWVGPTKVLNRFIQSSWLWFVLINGADGEQSVTLKPENKRYSKLRPGASMHLIEWWRLTKPSNVTKALSLVEGQYWKWWTERWWWYINLPENLIIKKGSLTLATFMFVLLVPLLPSHNPPHPPFWYFRCCHGRRHSSHSITSLQIFSETESEQYSLLYYFGRVIT